METNDCTQNSESLSFRFCFVINIRCKLASLYLREFLVDNIITVNLKFVSPCIIIQFK